MTKIITIVGARPQFIKAAAVSRALAMQVGAGVEEKIVHTGQHFDDNMSKVFFDELGIPQPHFHLAISGGSHGAMTGRMLEGIEQVLLAEEPDWVLIYGDTNSTLAGALAAAKLHIPVAHVEAGLRSFNMRMPEEVNRILSDRVSQLLLCPTDAAVRNLAAEGVTAGVHKVGDVMFDVALYYREKAKQDSNVLDRLGLRSQSFALATCHRAENTDDPQRLGDILSALADTARQLPVVLPLHPRTRKQIKSFNLERSLDSIRVTDPLSFLDMVVLEQSASLILTDSGGVQKEAFFYGVPCITMRDETEWMETVDSGWNQLASADRNKILTGVAKALSGVPSDKPQPYGTGRAADLIVQLLQS